MDADERALSRCQAKKPRQNAKVREKKIQHVTQKKNKPQEIEEDEEKKTEGREI